MRFERHILILVINILILRTSSYSQEGKDFQFHKCARLESGFATHFLSSKDGSTIIPGAAFQYCYGVKSTNKLGVGVGAGLQYFENESFVPFFIDAVYFLGQGQNASFLNLEAGYALGWSKNYADYRNSSYKGGPHLGISFGKKIIRLNQISLYLSTKVNHQFARVQYENDQYQGQKRLLHYNMLIFNLGFMLEE